MNKPTLQEVQQYWQSKNLNGDPAGFYDFYESKGWRVGKNPMTRWKAAASGWSRRQSESTTSKPSAKSTPMTFQQISTNNNLTWFNEAQAAIGETNDQTRNIQHSDVKDGSGSKSGDGSPDRRNVLGRNRQLFLE